MVAKCWKEEELEEEKDFLFLTNTDSTQTVGLYFSNSHRNPETASACLRRSLFCALTIHSKLLSLPWKEPLTAIFDMISTLDIEGMTEGQRDEETGWEGLLKQDIITYHSSRHSTAPTPQLICSQQYTLHFSYRTKIKTTYFEWLSAFAFLLPLYISNLMKRLSNGPLYRMIFRDGRKPINLATSLFPVIIQAS